MHKKMEKLEGGYINDVYAQDGTVIKQFHGDELLSSSSDRRYRRELWALKRFGGVLAPRLIHNGGTDIEMEYIDGKPIDDLIRTLDEETKDDLLYQAGEKLRSIHCPIKISSRQLVDTLLHRATHYGKKAASVLHMAGIEPSDISSRVAEMVDPSSVRTLGGSTVHRDYWLNNTLYKNGVLQCVIDWELSGTGSPYEDFAIVDLWITREHGHGDAFWNGYGVKPDRATTNAYLMTKLVDFLSTTVPDHIAAEYEQGGGFYSNKLAILKELL
ncbi:MAG: aminoglycoside phosphotransferase family protein [Candidatus Roizmanbacteria bacterium]|nr:aminoglycoside phosphotransferase family protein [Candidatus Roizmanbacteria bacterium]